MPSLIELQNVTKEYQTGGSILKALNDVSLTIEEKEFVAIVGASGSGKSTMMNIIGLLDRPTSGTYFLSGNDATRLNENEQAMIRNQQIGFIFQSFFLLPKLTALQNVVLPLAYRGIGTKMATKLGLEILDKVGVKEWSHHKPNQLSGGQQQRVAVARALVGDPEVILADEPTGALDSKTSDQLMLLLKQLHTEEEKTILLITHNPELSLQCPRVITLKDGKIIGDENTCAIEVPAREEK